MIGPEFVILDVEATAGDPLEGRLMEMAVIVHNGEEVVDRWHSLIDPGEDVPRFIRSLTGIAPSMLEGAPRFAQLVHLIDGLTESRTLVAHNARYDMTVLQMEFERAGHQFSRQVICTERLCRIVEPGLERYNLRSLCEHFKIPYRGHHRAMSDAQATTLLFERLLAMSTTAQLKRALRYHSVSRRAS